MNVKIYLQQSYSKFTPLLAEGSQQKCLLVVTTRCDKLLT